MEVQIDDYTGQNKFVLEVEPNDTFENVKAKIQEKKQIPADIIDLYHKGTLLENESTVTGFRLERGSSLNFFISFEKMKAKMDEEALVSEKAKKESEEKAKKDKKEAEEKGKKKAENVDDHRSGDPALVSFIQSYSFLAFEVFILGSFYGFLQHLG